MNNHNMTIITTKKLNNYCYEQFQLDLKKRIMKLNHDKTQLVSVLHKDIKMSLD